MRDYVKSPSSCCMAYARSDGHLTIDIFFARALYFYSNFYYYCTCTVQDECIKFWLRFVSVQQ